MCAPLTPQAACLHALDAQGTQLTGATGPQVPKPAQSMSSSHKNGCDPAGQREPLAGAEQPTTLHVALGLGKCICGPSGPVTSRAITAISAGR